MAKVYTKQDLAADIAWNKEHPVGSVLGCRKLWCALIADAAQDVRKHKSEHGREFLVSQSTRAVMDSMGLNRDAIIREVC